MYKSSPALISMIEKKKLHSIFITNLNITSVLNVTHKSFRKATPEPPVASASFLESLNLSNFPNTVTHALRIESLIASKQRPTPKFSNQI